MRIVAVVLLAAWAAACARPDPARIEYRREPESAELVAMLENGDSATRARAALAMGRIQSPFYAEPLVAAVTDGEAQVRVAAWFALGQLGLAHGASPPEVATETARRGLENGDAEVVAMAVEATGKLAPPDAAATLVPLLSHASPEVRAEAAHALLRLRFVPTWRGESPDPPPLPDFAVEALAATLGDEDPGVRQAAAHALSRYGEARAAAALAGVGDDPDPWVRMFAVRGVGRAGASEQADAIAWGLDDPDLHVRTETVITLGVLGRTDLIPARLDRDDSFHVRAAVATALGGADIATSSARLRGLERDPSTSVRAQAIVALARSLGTEYLDPLRAYGSSDSWIVRAAAARGAALVGAEAIDVPLYAAADPDGRVRTAAIDSLGAFLDRPEVAAVVDAALDSGDLGERATAVGIVGSSDRPGLLERLAEVYDRSTGVEWIEVRESIVDAVSTSREATDLLRRIASSDPAPSVRARAHRALSTLGLDAPWGGPAALDARTERASLAEEPIVVLETDRGEIEIRLFPDDAPIHVSNFVRLVLDGFYDGHEWHRVVSNFVIQGGDPLGSGWGGPGYVIPDEINRRRYARGTVGMPKAGKDTGGCQIFVTHVPTPHLDGNYTVFGQVVSGLDVIDRLEVGDTIIRARMKV